MSSPTQNDENYSEQTEDNLFVEILKKHYGDSFLEKLKIRETDAEPVIIVDTREKGSRIGKKLEALGATIIMEVLDAGDYLCSGNCSVERKRGDDFRSSVFGGSNTSNIFEQLLRLSDAVEKPILILENFEKAFGPPGGDERASSIYGAMMAIALRLSIPIIPTRNTTDTAMALYRIAKRQQGEYIDRGIARRIPKSLTLKERQAYVLEGLFKVGPTKSQQLIEEFKCPINFFTELLNTEIVYTKNGNPKGITGKLAEVKGFGWKFVRDNKNLLLNEDEEELKEQEPESQRKDKYQKLL
jgi:ERCC4-type nuclease